MSPGMHAASRAGQRSPRPPQFRQRVCTAAFGLALLCTTACGSQPPRDLLATGATLSQVRLSKALADDPSGLRLDRIRHGGAAWNAGLRSGDYVLFVNELPVYSYEGGLHLLSRVDGATPTILMVSRGGETVRVEIPVPTE